MSVFSVRGVRAFVAFAACSILGTGAAQAAVNITSVALDTPGGKNGTLSYTAPPSTNYSISGGIGRIRLTGTDTDTNTAISYLSYCLDIFHDLDPGTFTFSGTSTLGLSATKLSQLNAIISNSDSLATDADHSAATQLALWEIAFENGPTYDLDGGNFKVTGDNANARSIANTYLGYVSNSTWVANASLPMALLVSPGDQTQLVWGPTAASFANASSAVPESSNWAMMVLGFGMLGMVLRGRRRSDADTAAAFARL